MKRIILLLVILLSNDYVFRQVIKNDTLHSDQNSSINFKSLVIPTAFITYGFIGLGSDVVKDLNTDIQIRINADGEYKSKIDNYIQYTPMFSVYGLNAIGVKGKNNFKDRTIIIGSASIIMITTVTGLKKLTGVERPDGGSRTSFPSGHTATAFMGAEFLFQEYKEVSPWIGVSGYLVATGAGYLRMYNNRHWFTDVVTGAGIGILSTKIAYWIQPWMKEKIFKDKKENVGNVIPFYNGREAGLGLTMLF
jgi:hypothetical protein